MTLQLFIILDLLIATQGFYFKQCSVNISAFVNLTS